MTKFAALEYANARRPQQWMVDFVTVVTAIAQYGYGEATAAIDWIRSAAAIIPDEEKRASYEAILDPRIGTPEWCAVDLPRAFGLPAGSQTRIIRKREWGPSLWRLLHYCLAHVKVNPPPAALRSVLASLPLVVPCKECSSHLRKVYETDPVPNRFGRDRITKWWFTVHNRVNAQLGKPQFTLAQFRILYGDCPDDAGVLAGDGVNPPAKFGRRFILGLAAAGIGAALLISLLAVGRRRKKRG